MTPPSPPRRPRGAARPARRTEAAPAPAPRPTPRRAGRRGRRRLAAAPGRPRRIHHPAVVPRPPQRHLGPHHSPPRRRRHAPRGPSHAPVRPGPRAGRPRRGPPPRRTIRAKTLELAEERGIAAGPRPRHGQLDGSRCRPRAAAPVLLRSCMLKPTGAAQEDFSIDLGAEVELNPVLEHYLRSEQGLEIDTAAWRTWPARPTASTPTRVCRAGGPVRGDPRLRGHPGWSLAPSPTPSCRWWPTSPPRARRSPTTTSSLRSRATSAPARRPRTQVPDSPPTRTPPASTSSSTPTPPSRPPSTRCAVAPTWSSRGRPAPASRRRSPTSSPRWQARASGSSSSPRSGRPSTPSSPAWREWACPTSSSTPTTVPPTSGGSQEFGAALERGSAAEDPDTSAVERTLVERRDRLVGHAAPSTSRARRGA